MPHLFVNAKSSMIEILDAISEFVLTPSRGLFSNIAAKGTTSGSSFVLTSPWKSFKAFAAGTATPKPGLVFKSPSRGSISTQDRSSTYGRFTTDTSVSTSGSSVAIDTVHIVPSPFERKPLTPALFLDAEGVQLSRNGELCILEVHVHHRHHQQTCIINICSLKDLAFSTPSTDRLFTLNSMLQDPKVPKVLFDVRMDSVSSFSRMIVIPPLVAGAPRRRKRWLCGGEIAASQKIVTASRKNVAPRRGSCYVLQ